MPPLYGEEMENQTLENDGLNSESNVVESRWRSVDFGVTKTILKLLLINISDKVCGVVTILTSTALSIADTFSDIFVAFTLFTAGHYHWGSIVAVTD